MRISDWSSDVCSSDLLDLIFVKRVDHRDEARRLVAILRSHARDAPQDHAMELPCDREIVGGTARLPAQLPERKAGDARQCLWNEQRTAAPDVQGEARHLRAVPATGRASRGGGVCTDGWVEMGAVSLKKKK